MKNTCTYYEKLGVARWSLTYVKDLIFDMNSIALFQFKMEKNFTSKILSDTEERAVCIVMSCSCLLWRVRSQQLSTTACVDSALVLWQLLYLNAISTILCANKCDCMLNILNLCLRWKFLNNITRQLKLDCFAAAVAASSSTFATTGAAAVQSAMHQQKQHHLNLSKCENQK